MNMERIVLLKLRFIMAFIFLWAFFDKVFGLGFATTSEKAWINGGSPTTGFLSGAVKGPLAEFFHAFAGAAWVDWVFMLALLFIGLTLLFNRFVFWGALVGIVLMIAMWLALLLPANNPIVDEHIVYALVLYLLALKSKLGQLSY